MRQRTGQRLHLHVLERRALRQRKIVDLRLCKLDVSLDRVGHLIHALANLCLAQAKTFRLPLIKLLRVLAQRTLAVLGNVRQYPLDRPACLRLLFGRHFRGLTGIQVTNHGCLLAHVAAHAAGNSG